MNKNLIFLHLPKNAGTTFYSILSRYFSASETIEIGYNKKNAWTLDEFTLLPEEKRAQIRLIIGHFMFGLHKYLLGDSDYITFLRKPVERTVSVYNHVKRNPHNRLYNEVKTRSLYDFVTQVRDYDIVNGQTRKISGINGSADEMLEVALENIEKHFSFVGLQEKFDESLVALGNIYTWSRLYYKQQNVSRNGVTVSELDDNTIEAIKELNGGDLRLYAIMERRFDEGLSQIPLSTIKCKALQLTNQLYSLIK